MLHRAFLLFWGCYLLLPYNSLAAQAPQAKIAEVGIYINNLYDLNFFASGRDATSFKVNFWVWFKTNEQQVELEKKIEVIGGRDLKMETSYTENLPDGRIYRSAKYTATINQDWNVRFYPFDTQNIKISFENTQLNADQLQFIPDIKNSDFDPKIVLPGWSINSIAVKAYPYKYHSDWGTESGPQTYSRLEATIKIERSAPARIFTTSFLGFFVADILTGATMLVESFASIRHAIPSAVRMNMLSAALFGAVGNKYIIDNAIPPTKHASMPDLIQFGSFSSIAIALATVVSTETFTRMGYSAGFIDNIGRAGLAALVGLQLGSIWYFLNDKDESP